MKKEKVIMGIDPGTTRLGYGVIRIEDNRIETLSLGVLMLHKIPDHSAKLQKIFQRITQLVDQYLPDELAIEAPFFGKNVQSMLKLGRAQGVAMAAALQRDIPVTEYSPRKIKQSITGNGNASKEQVAAMLETTLKAKLDTHYDDATDGLAVALCHYYQGGSAVISGGKNGGWDKFLKENPGRVGLKGKK